MIYQQKWLYVIYQQVWCFFFVFFWAVRRSLFILCIVYIVILDGYSYLFEIKPCRFTSMDNQPKRKNCVSDSRKHWNIVFVVLRYFFIFTMFCFASFSFFHALLSRSLHGKIAVLDLRNFHSLYFLWCFFILGFTIDLYSKVYVLPVCVIAVFVSNHWKVFLFWIFLFHKEFRALPSAEKFLLIIIDNIIFKFWKIIGWYKVFVTQGRGLCYY